MPTPRPLDPFNPGGMGATRLGGLGKGSPGGLRRPVGLLNPLNPISSYTPRVVPRIQQGQPAGPSRVGARGVTLPKDLLYQAKTGADVISNTPALISNPKSKAAAEARLVASFEKRNLPPEYMEAIKDVIYQRRAYGERQNQSTVQAINRVLTLPENVGAGFLTGTHKFQAQHGIQGFADSWKYLAHPSYVFKEFGAGFAEIPDALAEQKSYDELIKETTTPGSFVYRYSMPIGLGMSVLFDPTTYMTFGASSASKSAAYHVLAESDRHAFSEAHNIIKKNYGSKVDTVSGPVVANWHNLDSIVNDVKVKNNLPVTLGDALDIHHAQGLAVKREIRETGEYWSGKTGEMVPASTRQKITARVLPNNVQGGRGVRFAGREIPGTPRLGAALAKQTRKLGEDASTAPFDLGSMMIPQWGARHVVDDGARASALVEMAKYRTAMSRAQMNIGRDVRGLQRVAVPDDTVRMPVDAPLDELKVPLTDWHPATLENQNYDIGDNEFFVTAARNRETGEIVSSTRDHTEIIDDMGAAGIEDPLNHELWEQHTALVNRNGEVQSVNTNPLHPGARPEWTEPDTAAAVKEHLEAKFQQAKDFHEETLANVASDAPQFKRVLVRPEERANLMSMDISELTPAQKILKNNINTSAEVYIDKAVEAGIGEKEIRRLWDHTVDYYEDPLMALAEFKFKSTARAMSRNFTEEILQDTRFAIPMNSKAQAEAILRKDFIEAGTDLHKLDEAPMGFSEFTQGNRRYAVRNSIIEGLREINNPTRLDTSLQRGFRMLNKPQDLWKLYATSPNPAFHVMNFLGAVWNNMLAGVYNPADYFDALKLLYKGRKEEAAQAGAKFGVTRQVPKSTEGGKAAQQVLSEAEARAGLGRSSFLFADVSRGHYTPEQLAMSDLPLSETASMFEKLQSQGLESGKGFAKRAIARPTKASGKEVGNIRYGVSLGRKAAGVALAAHANPLAFAMFLPEAAKAGRAVGGTIEDLVRLAPFMKYSDDPAVRRVLANYGPINSSMRMTHKGFTKEDQQTMYDIGAHISRHFQFDYSDLTSFERYFAKSVFPFWVYYKKNLGLQIAQLAHKPVTFAVANRMMNYINENQEMNLGPWEEILPSYFNNLGAFQVPVPNTVRDKMGLPHDQPLYLNPKMPFMALNLIPNFFDIIRNPTQTNSQKMLELISPVAGAVGPFSPTPVPGAKILLEAGTGYNLGLNRPIDFQRANSNDLRQSYVPAPGWTNYLPDWAHTYFGIRENKKNGKQEMSATSKYVLEQMSAPFINNLGKSISPSGATDEEAGRARADLVSWLSGVRLMPVDVLRLDRNAAYVLIDQLEAEQSDLRSQGKELPLEKKVILARIRGDLKIINFAYKEREADPTNP